MKAKIVLGLLAALVFGTIFNWNYNERINYYQVEKYTAVLNKIDSKGSKYHLTLHEVKNDAALIGVLENGSHLLAEGEHYQIAKPNGHFILGDFFQGEIEVLSIENGEVTVKADIEMLPGFKRSVVFTTGILAGMISGLFFMMGLGIINCFKWLRQKRKRRHLRIVS